MASLRSPTRGRRKGNGADGADGGNATDGALEPPPTGLRTSALAAGDHSLVVFSYPIPTDTPKGVAHGGSKKRGAPAAANLDVLTPVEREVVRGVLGGQTNAEIAALRGRSVHTINRQVEAAYRKLGVGSRGELCARFAGTRSGRP